jgi:hypothetical protein
MNLKAILIQQVKDWIDYEGYRGYDEILVDDVEYAALEAPDRNPDVEAWIKALSKDDFNALAEEITNTMATEYWEE